MINLWHSFKMAENISIGQSFQN